MKTLPLLPLAALALTACQSTRAAAPPPAPPVAVEVVQLHYASANVLAGMLDKLDIEGLRAVSDTRTNSLLLRGSPEGLERVHDLVAALDVAVQPEGEATATQTAIIPLRYAEADQVAALLRRVVQNVGGRSKSALRIEPDARTNSIVVVGEDAALAQMRELVTRLDVQVSGG